MHGRSRVSLRCGRVLPQTQLQEEIDLEAELGIELGVNDVDDVEDEKGGFCTQTALGTVTRGAAQQHA